MISSWKMGISHAPGVSIIRRGVGNHIHYLYCVQTGMIPTGKIVAAALAVTESVPCQHKQVNKQQTNSCFAVTRLSVSASKDSITVQLSYNLCSTPTFCAKGLAC